VSGGGARVRVAHRCGPRGPGRIRRRAHQPVGVADDPDAPAVGPVRQGEVRTVSHILDLAGALGLQLLHYLPIRLDGGVEIGVEVSDRPVCSRCSPTRLITLTYYRRAHGALYSVSPTGTYAGDTYVTNSNVGSNTVSVINTNNAVVTNINVGSGPIALAVSPTGPQAGDIYVANTVDGTVSVINPATNTVIATVDVGTNPYGVAVSPTGSDAGDIYVTNRYDGTVSVLS
jgi:YVTN family beta-propeller protein